MPYDWYVTVGVRTESGGHVAITTMCFPNTRAEPTNEDREELKVISRRASAEIRRCLERREAANRGRKVTAG